MLIFEVRGVAGSTLSGNTTTLCPPAAELSDGGGPRPIMSKWRPTSPKIGLASRHTASRRDLGAFCLTAPAHISTLLSRIQYAVICGR
jgi:hypothetical protein